MLKPMEYKTYQDFCHAYKGVGEYIMPKARWDALKLEQQREKQ